MVGAWVVCFSAIQCIRVYITVDVVINTTVRCDSNLDPLTSQSDALTSRPLWPAYQCIKSSNLWFVAKTKKGEQVLGATSRTAKKCYKCTNTASKHYHENTRTSKLLTAYIYNNIHGHKLTTHTYIQLSPCPCSFLSYSTLNLSFLASIIIIYTHYSMKWP